MDVNCQCTATCNLRCYDSAAVLPCPIGKWAQMHLTLCSGQPWAAVMPTKREHQAAHRLPTNTAYKVQVSSSKREDSFRPHTRIHDGTLGSPECAEAHWQGKLWQQKCALDARQSHHQHISCNKLPHCRGLRIIARSCDGIAFLCGTCSRLSHHLCSTVQPRQNVSHRGPYTVCRRREGRGTPAFPRLLACSLSAWCKKA